MFDRAKVIEQNLKNFVANAAQINNFTDEIFFSHHITNEKIIEIFESQLISRLLDLKARQLRSLGKAFYTIGSSGHEGMALIGEVARVTDMAFLHYRDCAFMVQRSKKVPGTTIINDLLLSFCAAAEDPTSGGRHKVLGSLALNIPPQTSTIASHLPKAVGAALSFEKNRKLQIASTFPHDSVIVCTFGDASLNHASAQSALNTASWISYQHLPLPIVFVCEDNGIGISVPTPPDWVRQSRIKNDQIKYFECDGTHLLNSIETVQAAFQYSRSLKRPSFIRFKTVRLMGHAGSDLESAYLQQKTIEKNEDRDPVLKTAQLLIHHKILTPPELIKIYHHLDARINRIALSVSDKPKITNALQVMESLLPTKKIREAALIPSNEQRQNLFGSEWTGAIDQKQNMAKLINLGLNDLLLRYKSAVLFGEDVAKKGGVYGVTANLVNRFGTLKVFNSLLDETNILGTAIGLAHNNILPIPEIQFLAYVHNAEDQIRGEAATLSFFSNQQFTNGMVVRIAGLAYQKGFGGHFHNDNSLAIFRDIPGIIIACPSNGKDAVLMMRSCVEQAYLFGRVCVFIEPIALYPVKDLMQPGDGLWSFEYPKDLNQQIEVGQFELEFNDKELCLVSYGNGYFLSKQAQSLLKEKYNINISLIDLRWIAPLDIKKICSAVSKFKNILIVEECRQTGSFSEQLITTFYEHCQPLPKLKRICSLDSFIPLADAANLVLVQTEDIVTASLQLLGKNHV